MRQKAEAEGQGWRYQGDNKIPSYIRLYTNEIHDARDMNSRSNRKGFVTHCADPRSEVLAFMTDLAGVNNCMKYQRAHPVFLMMGLDYHTSQQRAKVLQRLITLNMTEKQFEQFIAGLLILTKKLDIDPDGGIERFLEKNEKFLKTAQRFRDESSDDEEEYFPQMKPQRPSNCDKYDAMMQRFSSANDEYLQKKLSGEPMNDHFTPNPRTKKHPRQEGDPMTVDSAPPDTGGAASSGGKGLGKADHPVRNLLSGLDAAHLGKPPVVADPPAETH